MVVCRPMATDFQEDRRRGKGQRREIEVLARILAEKMEAIHGSEFLVLTDHQARFVMVAVR
ncbi:hypothetical protein CK224_30420 [Mesorhizobium sp. WSM3862]|nr:hypothetical protein CK224_30420 [Mesorhizobium sp. WSM3862]